MGLLEDPNSIVTQGRKRPAFLLFLLVIIGAGLFLKSYIETAGENAANRGFLSSSDDSASGSPTTTEPAVAPATNDVKLKEPNPQPPPVVAAINLRIDLLKNGRPVSGAGSTRVGSGHDGVVTS